MHNRLSGQGVAILGFPCNQFGGQEPRSNAEIKAFVAGYGAGFDIFDKIKVNGTDACDLFKWLKSKKGDAIGRGIKWNFAKFLVDRTGKVVERYLPTTAPLDIEPRIMELLAEPQ